MLLEINNIGKIQKASVEMRGITVIAGNNNTGKSTYGKILYCMFNAFCDAKSAIQKERMRNFENIIFRSFRNSRNPRTTLRTFTNSIIEHKASREEIRSLLKDAIDSKKIIIDRIEEDAVDSLVEKIIRSNEVTDEEIQKLLLTRFLTFEFGNRIVHVNHEEETGIISLMINGNRLSASIENNECIDFTDNVGIIHNALYIDTPFVMDEIDTEVFSRKIGHRERLIESLSKSSDGISAVDEILAKQQLQRILSGIRNVVNGEFRQTDEDGWMFQEEGLNKPLGMFNISTGMKPFLIIKRLLEAGEIKEQSVLVFDEPEIHLHPEWQLKYAELLVLLQKEFNVNILLTTHSPYFLNALEVYSRKNDISNRCNYYLAETRGDVCGLTDVTDNLELIYQKLARPFQELENLRYRED